MSYINGTVAVRQAELIHITPKDKRIIRETLAYNKELLEYLSDVVMSHWDELACLTSKERLTRTEKLIHKTKQNPAPEYKDFDTKFMKLPSGIRRAAINIITGAVSSYYTRLADYEQERHDEISSGHRFRKKPPKYSPPAACLTYYSTMFNETDHGICIKVRDHGTWCWITVSIASRDIKSLAKAKETGTALCPTLSYKNHKFYLSFPFQFPYGKYPEADLFSQTVMGVDLGINHGAVCSVIDIEGNVLHRDFDPFRHERKLLDAIIARIRMVQKKSGTGQELSAVYQKLAGRKDNYVKQLAHWIVEKAMTYHVYGIVLEYLGPMKAKGRKKDKIHHWCKCRIRDYIKGMAGRFGIRVFFVNPKNTSALAFDGSGNVSRDKKHYSRCTFSTGKQYNCDLSASYNIAARYFIRALGKYHTSEVWDEACAKVTGLGKRTTCTLATLKEAYPLLKPCA